jgi:hypothetical protein
LPWGSGLPSSFVFLYSAPNVFLFLSELCGLVSQGCGFNWFQHTSALLVVDELSENNSPSDTNSGAAEVYKYLQDLGVD